MGSPPCPAEFNSRLLHQIKFSVIPKFSARMSQELTTSFGKLLFEPVLVALRLPVVRALTTGAPFPRGNGEQASGGSNPTLSAISSGPALYEFLSFQQESVARLSDVFVSGHRTPAVIRAQAPPPFANRMGNRWATR